MPAITPKIWLNKDDKKIIAFLLSLDADPGDLSKDVAKIILKRTKQAKSNLPTIQTYVRNYIARR